MLGGTHHVGRAIVEAGLARGWSVTTVTRGISGASTAGAEALHADRTDSDALSAALGGRSWDVVIDTWSGPPRVVRDAATLLVNRVGHYGYVSSRSVYCWPIPPGADEHGPVVDGDPSSPDAEGGFSPRVPRTDRYSSLTAAILPSGCSPPPTGASAASSTPSANRDTPPWASYSIYVGL